MKRPKKYSVVVLQYSRSSSAFSCFEQYTVKLGYIGFLRAANFIRYIRNPIYTRELLLFCTMGTGNFIRYIRLFDITESDIYELYWSTQIAARFIQRIIRTVLSYDTDSVASHSDSGSICCPQCREVVGQ